jgi:undecaprenyl diphosphate synthase
VATPDLDSPQAIAARLGAEGRLPRHVAIIMDGNGRWAQRQGLPRVEGHRAGAQAVRAATRTARRLGLQTLTLYAFSEQNWSRPAAEVEALLHLLVEYLQSELEELRKSDIRLVAIGNLPRMPLPVRLALQGVMAATAQHKTMTLALALSYGGREELVHAARTLAERVAKGTLKPEQIDEHALQAALWTAPLASDPDLIVRTSGEQRLSNFLLWQSAYAEFYFAQKDWPDFGDDDFATALIDYTRRERRFGAVLTP